jgi:ATP-binding cassette subfamily C (CFTR/MRP) protein 1
MVFSIIAWASTSFQMWWVTIEFDRRTQTNNVRAAYIKVAATSGERLHDMLLRIVMTAPLSFFSSTSSGSILNKFSQDIQLIDTDLPAAAMSLGTQVFKLITQIGLLLSVQRWMLLSIPTALAIVYVIQRVYLHTSRQLRYLELESRSDLFSSFLQTVEGLTTIRAFGWKENMEDKNINFLESSQRAMYILLCLQRWLNLVLDLMVAGIAISTVYLAITFRGKTNGASVGVALNIIIVTTTTLLRLVESWTQLEISFGAIARLKSMKESTPSELREGDLIPDEGWPSKGSLDFRQVTATYDGSRLALNQVSFKVTKGQKVAICGRTGSGKSTLMLSLLGMVDYSGSIYLDGIDLGQVCRKNLRERCFINIAQEAFLMPENTLRFNLDPSHMASDEAICQALEKVGLWQSIRDNTSEQSIACILNRTILSLPVFSAGQTQLLSLARAIIKRDSLVKSDERLKPVLLLDEATSSLDPATETIIHDMIDTEFVHNGHTALLITHRPDILAGRMQSGRDVFVFMKDGSVEAIQGAEEFFVQVEAA